MVRRLFKCGNSTVLSLPKEVMVRLGFKSGDSINLELDREHQWLIVTPVKKTNAISGINKEFARQVNEFIQQYHPALEELAK